MQCNHVAWMNQKSFSVLSKRSNLWLFLWMKQNGNIINCKINWIKMNYFPNLFEWIISEYIRADVSRKICHFLQFSINFSDSRVFEFCRIHFVEAFGWIISFITWSFISFLWNDIWFSSKLNWSLSSLTNIFADFKSFQNTLL